MLKYTADEAESEYKRLKMKFPTVYNGDLFKFHTQIHKFDSYWLCISASEDNNPFLAIGITDIERDTEKMPECPMKYHFGNVVINNEVIKSDLDLYLSEDNYMTYADLMLNFGNDDENIQKNFGIKYLMSSTDSQINAMYDAFKCRDYYNRILLHLEENASDHNGDPLDEIPSTYGSVWYTRIPNTDIKIEPAYAWLRAKEVIPVGVQPGSSPETSTGKEDESAPQPWYCGYEIYYTSSKIAIAKDITLNPSCDGFLKPWAWKLLDGALQAGAHINLPNIADMIATPDKFVKSPNETARDNPILNVWQMRKQEAPIPEELYDDYDFEEENRLANRKGTGFLLPSTGL